MPWLTVGSNWLYRTPNHVAPMWTTRHHSSVTQYTLEYPLLPVVTAELTGSSSFPCYSLLRERYYILCRRDGSVDEVLAGQVWGPQFRSLGPAWKPERYSAPPVIRGRPRADWLVRLSESARYPISIIRVENNWERYLTSTSGRHVCTHVHRCICTPYLPTCKYLDTLLPLNHQKDRVL